MKRVWKKFLPYGIVIIVVGVLTFTLIETIRAKNTGFETKTLWDWMELFIIPLALAIGAFYLNRSERAVERKIGEERAKLERVIETDRQREAALQTYLDRIADLLLKENLRVSEDKELRNVARIRTLTVLRRLDAKRKGIVLLFLYESGLIVEKLVINLAGADLTYADLGEANLNGVNLYGVNLRKADLSKANLSRAYLRETDLREGDLSEANLSGADLTEADLSGAYLRGAKLWRTNLSKASLRGVDLREADLNLANLGGSKLWGAKLNGANLYRTKLSEADLNEVDLGEANLSQAKVADEQLMTAKSLIGATMPDGKIHD